jgi:hypothetical protein
LGYVDYVITVLVISCLLWDLISFCNFLVNNLSILNNGYEDSILHMSNNTGFPGNQGFPNNSGFPKNSGGNPGGTPGGFQGGPGNNSNTTNNSNQNTSSDNQSNSNNNNNNQMDNNDLNSIDINNIIDDDIISDFVNSGSMMINSNIEETSKLENILHGLLNLEFLTSGLSIMLLNILFIRFLLLNYKECVNKIFNILTLNKLNFDKIVHNIMDYNYKFNNIIISISLLFFIIFKLFLIFTIFNLYFKFLDYVIEYMLLDIIYI